MASWQGLLDRLGDPNNPQVAGLLGGLTQFGSALAQAGQLRPLGQPAPGLADAFGAFSTGRQAGMLGAMKTQDMQRTFGREKAWRDAASGAPTTPEGTQLFNAIPPKSRSAIFAMGQEQGLKAWSAMLTQRGISAGPGHTIVAPDGTQTRIPITQEDIDYRQRGGSTQTVNVAQGPQVGTIPLGFQLEKTPEGAWRMSEVPGGPAALAAQDKAVKTAADKTNVARSGDVVMQDIDRALGLQKTSSLPVSGLGAATLSSIPGTGASDAKSLLESIKANVSFQTLAEMRKASATGGALGAISDREMSLLQAALGSLEQTQSSPQFRDNLARVRNIYTDIVHGPNAGPPRLPLSFQQPSPGGRGTIEPPAPASRPQQGGATMRWNPQTGRVEPVR